MSKILLVEDELELGEKFKKTFEKKGHSVDLVDNQEKAFECISKTERYDYLISDYNISGSNSKEIAIKFKEKYGTKICFISGDPSLEMNLLKECPEIACDFFTKPFSRRDLLEWIDNG